jgi:hypothetical protein
VSDKLLAEERKNNNNNNDKKKRCKHNKSPNFVWGLNYKLDELGVKLTGPVCPCNLDSGKSNVPGYIRETHGPLLAGTASSMLISSSVSVSVFLHITLFYQCLSKTKKMSRWRSTGKRQKCRFGAERVNTAKFQNI